MIRILKYKLAPETVQVLAFAGSVVPLHVDVDNGTAYLWAQVGDVAEPRAHRVFIFPTGAEVLIPDVMSAAYVGTYRLAEGRKMWHVYFDHTVLDVSPVDEPGDEEGLVLVNEKATTEL